MIAISGFVLPSATHDSTSASRGLKASVASSRGEMHEADGCYHRVRRVDAATGIITTVAGNGTRGYSGDDGPAAAASLDTPAGVAQDTSGNLFIADHYNYRVRRVDAATGIITTVAGTGISGFSGDGGPAIAAQLSRPTGLTLDAAGNLLLTDIDNHRVRRIAAPCGPVASPLIAWWPGDGTAADIAGTNNGTLQNGAAFGPGLVSQAFSFDGVDDQVTVPDSAALRVTGQITIAAWIRYAACTHSFGWCNIVSKAPDGQARNWNYGLIVNRFSGQLSFVNGNGASYFVQYAGPNLTDNSWHHVAVTYGAGRVRYYVDGAEVLSASNSVPLTANSAALEIGRESGEIAERAAFAGQLDELQIYGRVLTEAEILATVTAGAAGLCKVPVTPVVAAAGPDQTVNEGDFVTLDGSASSGTNLTYSWSQLAGPPVTVSGATSSTATFTAPQLPGGFGSQALTFQLTVNNGANSSSATVNVAVVNVNHAPIAAAIGPANVNEGSSVTLSGTTSYDPDGDPTTYQWTQTGGPVVDLVGAATSAVVFIAPLLPGGAGAGMILTFRLTVSDGALTDADDVSVTVEQVNHAPTADAGDPQTVQPGRTITLAGSGGDADGDPVSYAWTQVQGPAVTLADSNTPSPSFVAPPVSGTVDLVFRLTVSDSQLSATSDVAITVKNGPPVCDRARATPALLWPPNHGLVGVAIGNVSDPDDDTFRLLITGVTQDEPTNGLGDGDTSPDAVIQGDKVLLRAERSGTGNGRVYSIMFSADDGLGGVCTGSATVQVPKSMKAGGGAIDDGQSYDSGQP